MQKLKQSLKFSKEKEVVLFPLNGVGLSAGDMVY
jgi:hypothetical protein